MTSHLRRRGVQARPARQWEDAAEAWHRWGPAIEDWLGHATAAHARRGRRDRRQPACSTSPPARAGRPSPLPAGPVRPGTCWPPTSRPPSSRTRRDGRDGRRPAATSPPGSSTASTSTSRRPRFDAVHLPGRADLLPGPARRPAPACTRALRPGGRIVRGRLLDGRPQRVLLRAGRHHPAARPAAPAAARPARPVQPRRPRRRRGRPRGGRFPRRHRRRRRRRRCGWPPPPSAWPVRARVVRRAAPDARRACPNPSARRPGRRSPRRSAQFEGPDGFAGPCEMLVVTGTK